MHQKVLHFLATVSLVLLAGSAFAQQIAYKPGGGVQIFSEEEAWKFRLLGYIQSTQTLHTREENDAVNNEFFVRRARLDFIFDFRNRYQIFFELDARGSRTEMVLAQFDVKYAANHQIQVGKFITPFSPENNRSSRSLTTVERYSGLNSIFLLPGLDTQYGIMFYGNFVSKLKYYLSITNGNGKASDNLHDNNNNKDLQGRLELEANSKLKLGASVNVAKEAAQTLSLVDHTFAGFNRAAIAGDRMGFLGYFEYNAQRLLLRGEAFQFRFSNDLSAEQQVGNFFGAYGELGYFLRGNTSDGFQLVGRVESARYGDIHQSLEGPQNLTTLLVGNNWYRDDIFRLQVNLIYELADSESLLPSTRFTGVENAFEILTMLQLKF